MKTGLRELFRPSRKKRKREVSTEERLVKELIKELKSLREEKKKDQKRIEELRREIDSLRVSLTPPAHAPLPMEKAVRDEEPREFVSAILELRLMGVDPKHTFETFLVDANNAFAYKVSKSIVERPAAVYNPVFIYGDVGTGKTHLLHAIANGIKQAHPTLKILYAPVERFINEMIKAVDYNRLENFRKRFREVDVLLIDDVQFLSGKMETQIEFFHTFNELYNRGAQIVLSSDRPPVALEQLEARLRSRFQAGLILDVKPPGHETRIMILKARCSELGVSPPREVLEKISNLFPKNVREMLGALNRVVAYSQFMEVPLTTELVDEVLQGVMFTEKTTQNVAYTEPLREEDIITEEDTGLVLELSADRIEKTLMEELEKIRKSKEEE
ncbi:MAG: ATP-binding protein [Thermoplasmata archaeon]|nr:ATP-binding protein [Thermoplasmata archaeon]